MPVPVPSRSAGPRASLARRAPAAAALLGLTLLLAGCAGSSAELTSSSDAGAVAPGAPGTGSLVAPLPGVVDTKSASGGTADYAVSPQQVANDRSIVVRADVGVRVDDVVKATSALGTLATGHDATISSQSSSAGDTTVVTNGPTNPDGTPACPSTGCPTTYASSTTTLRVDNAEVDALLADIARLGKVETATRTSDDVTADVADVDARVRNAQASVARVRALMARATTIGEIVALEGELSRRQADLEALEARQRALADQTAQATVTVRLYGSTAPVATTTVAETGFLAGLRSGWDSFTGFMAGALTVLGALVPWLIVIVPLAWAVWLVARRRRETPNVVDQAG